MDRMLAAIIVFTITMIALAATLSMGVVPQIFKTGNQVNQTQATVNATLLFAQQRAYNDAAMLNQSLAEFAHEDQARDIQTQKEQLFEMQGRTNQTRVLINQVKTMIIDHQIQLQNYIDKQNNTTRKLFEELSETQKQNDEIIKTQKNLSLSNNEMLKKFGSENNAMQRATLESQGKDPNTIINDFYKKYPQFETIVPPPTK